MDYINEDNSYTSPLVYVIAFVLAVHMFTFPFVMTPHLTDTGPTWLGLDVSWQMTLSYANMKDWVWGKDIVYTYGPLGFLSTRIGWGVSRWVFVAFDLLLIINFFFVFKDFLKASASKLMGTLILVAATLLMNTHHGTDLSWVLMFLVYYWLYKAYLSPSLLSFVMICLLTVIAFYVKVNTGIVTICVIAAYMLLIYIANKISLLKAILIIASLFIAIVVTAALLHVHLPGYISGAFEIIKGYNDVMHMNNGEARTEDNLGLLYHMLKYLFIAYFIYVLLKGKFVHFFFIAICAGYILLLKKQAFLRGDIQHLSEFFCYAPLVLLTGNFLYFKNNTQKLFSAAILFIITIALFFKTEFHRNIDELYKDRYTNKKEYIRQFKESKDKSYLFQKDKRIIPDTLLTKIGSESIDVFPWDSQYLIENKLNYSPRPIFQSFSAYTAYLQQINYDKYVQNAPRYILYDYDAIDGRYPFNDEGLLNMFIVKNYWLSDTFTSNERLRALLVKKELTSPLTIQLVGEEEFRLSDNIEIKPGVNFVKIDIANNFKGKKQAFQMRPQHINVRFTDYEGQSHSFKTSISLLKAGLKVNELVANQHDYLSLLTQKETLKKIKSISLELDVNYFKEKGVIKYYNVK